ncbi:MAG: gluconate 2-dehydrogenase subunit 3 family protein [Bryobacteraceae bacterium]
MAQINRRELVELLAGAAFALQLPAAEPGAPLFFTKDEFALLDCLTDLIIPTDEHSPGAHAAGVAAFIDRTTAEAFLAKDKQSWREGLKVVNNLSQQMNGAPFLETRKEQQAALLSKLAQNEEKEKDPRHGDKEDEHQTPEQKFWGQLKQTTASAYYSSNIGIHQDMNYKGNVYLKEFVGYDAA